MFYDKIHIVLTETNFLKYFLISHETFSLAMDKNTVTTRKSSSIFVNDLFFILFFYDKGSVSVVFIKINFLKYFLICRVTVLIENVKRNK